MKRGKKVFISFVLTMQIFAGNLSAQIVNKMQDEQYRPQVHFTPKAHWINDPNGMVYSNGIYHLFFQYHPGSSVWGPMHWGHATSKDMIHWKEQPVGIYPDSIGTIFSGSAVVDKNNTSGFGKNGKAPLIAIFTQHNMQGEKELKTDFQNQSIAYSNDDGKTWVKYEGNPVVKNPGQKDFRDPKVMWYPATKRWIMSLAVKDYISFYSSPDLKNWTKESDFGEGRGAHGGGWECPDLLSLDDNGKQRWVLIVNLNPGAPNGGSGTQYFVGDFNGHEFTSAQKQTFWMDYGPDNYAGITWSNTGKRKTLIGWMSNWQYAEKVPTETWRGAMTIPRDLQLKHIGGDIMLVSALIPELSALQSKTTVLDSINVSRKADITKQLGSLTFPCKINLEIDKLNDFSLVLFNALGEELVIGYEKKENKYFIDRTKSGKIDFEKDFGARHFAPRFTTKNFTKITLIIESGSVELFADDGATVMTEIFFPTKPYAGISLSVPKNIVIRKMEYSPLKSVYRK